VATNYPGALDSLTNPGAGDALNSPSHSAQHTNANDAIEAVETELGVNPSGSDATVAARLSAIEAGTNLATGAVTSAKIADGTIATADIADGAVTPAKLSIPVFVGSGSSSPEGSVTATPQQRYLQTSGAATATGAQEWVKATGTGNTGWVAGAESDTGWRSVSADLLNSGTGTLLVRRVGGTVNVIGSLDGTSASSTSVITLAQAFRPKAQIELPVSRNTSVTDNIFVTYSTGAAITLWRGTGKGAGQAFNIVTLTNEAWPSSLPGSAA